MKLEEVKRSLDDMYALIRALDYISMADKLRSSDGITADLHNELTTFIALKRTETAEVAARLDSAEARQVVYLLEGITSKNPWRKLEDILNRKIVRTNKG